MTLCASCVHTKYRVLCEHNARNYTLNSDFSDLCNNMFSQRRIDVFENSIQSCDNE